MCVWGNLGWERFLYTTHLLPDVSLRCLRKFKLSSVKKKKIKNLPCVCVSEGWCEGDIVKSQAEISTSRKPAMRLEGSVGSSTSLCFVNDSLCREWKLFSWWRLGESVSHRPHYTGENEPHSLYSTGSKSPRLARHFLVSLLKVFADWRKKIRLDDPVFEVETVKFWGFPPPSLSPLPPAEPGLYLAKDWVMFCLWACQGVGGGQAGGEAHELGVQLFSPSPRACR